MSILLRPIILQLERYGRWNFKCLQITSCQEMLRFACFKDGFLGIQLGMFASHEIYRSKLDQRGKKDEILSFINVLVWTVCDQRNFYHTIFQTGV